MSLACNGVLSLALVFFLLVGVGCNDQEVKSKDRGHAVTDKLRDAKKSVADAESKVQKNVEPLEQESK